MKHLCFELADEIVDFVLDMEGIPLSEEEYEKNLGFKEDIEFTLLSRTLEDVKETQVFKFKGRIIFTTAFRKPPLGLYIKNLREISKYIKKEHNIFENLRNLKCIT